MANKELFGREARIHARVPVADTHNLAGGKAYKLSPKAALAQYAATGTFGRTFYAGASMQLDQLKICLEELKDDPQFIAQAAVYSRRSGYLKDMPALLYVFLAQHGHTQWADYVFDVVCNNGKMVRNVIQICEAGVFGRITIPRSTRRKVANWLNTCAPRHFLNSMVGTDPSLAQVIKKVHAKPRDDVRRAMFGYARNEVSRKAPVGHTPPSGAAPPNYRYLPQLFHARDTWLGGQDLGPAADLAVFDGVDQRLFAGQPLDAQQWAKMARNAKWHATIKNLATYARHGAFRVDPELKDIICRRLVQDVTNPYVMAMPYEVLAAYTAVVDNADVPWEIRSDALQDAIEASAHNAPVFPGSLAVFVDVSGSMNAPVTGYRRSSSSKVTCAQAGAVMAACLKHRNPQAHVLGFHYVVENPVLNHRDSVMSNAEKIYKLPSGGTNCASTIEYLIANDIDVDTVILFSDNESWFTGRLGMEAADRYHMRRKTTGTTTMHAWETYRARHNTRNSKLILCDLTPSDDSQCVDRPDICHVGGFSDAIFRLMAKFAQGETSGEHWISEISRVSFD